MKLPLIFLLMATLLSGCASTTNSSLSGVQRSQLLLLPTATVNQLSAKSYAQTVQQAQKKQTLNVNKALLQRVTSISNRLIAQVGVFRPDAKNWQWEINVENNEQLNAYCMPGGKIMVFSGLAEKLNATDDELAAVIGHEIAHALREHGRERMSQAYVQQFGLQALASLIGGNLGSMAAQGAGMGSQLLFSLPNGREQEREADRMGLELAARAGYSPEAAVSLWQKMTAANKNSPPEFLSTHPSSDSRIKDLQALIPTVMPLYLAAKGK